MKSKMLFFNPYIILEDIKRYWGVAVLYFLALFFIGPMNMMLRTNYSNQWNYEQISRIFYLRYNEEQVILYVVLPILLSLLLFRYLHQSKSTTFIHGLPLSRDEWFHSHNIAGILLLLLPIIVNGVIFRVILNTYENISVPEGALAIPVLILRWIGMGAIINLVTYFIANLVAMITGNTLVQGALTLISIFLPIGFANLIMFNFEQLIYGFTINKSLVEKYIINIMPITAMVSNEQVTTKVMLWYVLFSIMLYIIANYTYKKRQLERASDSIAFDILKPIFKYGVTFSTMVLLGAYFYSIKQADNWLYIGYIIGGLLGYIIAEMIIQKTIWIFKNMKGLFLYAIVIFLLFSGIKLDVMGYESRIPEIEEIESVYYSQGLYMYWKDEAKTLETEENIHDVRQLHQQLIERKVAFSNLQRDQFYRIISIVYELKNGQTIAREYAVPVDFYKTNPSIAGIVESKEYKKNTHPIFQVDQSKINYVKINSDFHASGKRIKLLENDEMLELIEHIQADVLEETYEDYISERKPWGTMSLHYELDASLEGKNKPNTYIPWKKSYRHVSAWLKEKGYHEKVMVTAEDIDYVVIEKLDESLALDDHYRTVEVERAFEKGTNKQRLTLKDPTQINDVLMIYNDRSPKNKQYIIGIYFKNGNNALGWLDEQNAPRFVKDTFK